MKRQYKIVDPKDWRNMDGDTELEKRINAYLTIQFVWNDKCPSDECLNEAKHIVALFHEALGKP